MFATHLWVRAAAVMSGGAEEPSPVKAFLSPLNLLEYRDLLKEQGYDDPSDYGNMTAQEVEQMKAVLAAGGMKRGKVEPTARRVEAECRRDDQPAGCKQRGSSQRQIGMENTDRPTSIGVCHSLAYVTQSPDGPIVRCCSASSSSE